MRSCGSAPRSDAAAGWFGTQLLVSSRSPAPEREQRETLPERKPRRQPEEVRGEREEHQQVADGIDHLEQPGRALPTSVARWLDTAQSTSAPLSAMIVASRR